MNTKKVARNLDNLAMAMVVIGFIGMCQPFTMVLYSYGFTVILIGVILLNVAGHM
jgi:hypothetical protein